LFEQFGQMPLAIIWRLVSLSGCAGEPNHFSPSGMSCITPDCAATVT
jgi:hypothetical protein